MVSCCGNKFCQSCISHILNKNNRCPLCGQTNITTMPDRQLERTLNSLEIYCVHAEEGCKWTGELRELQRHLNQSYSKTDWLKGCEYENVKCKHCHRKFSRMEVTHHMIDCPEARIPCEFKVYGCTKVVMRKNMTKHIGENTEHHTSVMENWAKSLGLSSRLHHAAKQFSREIRGRGEEYVSRAELYNLVNELKFFACGHAEYTLQKTNGLLWKAGGVFLILALHITTAKNIENTCTCMVEDNLKVEKEIQTLLDNVNLTEIIDKNLTEKLEDLKNLYEHILNETNIQDSYWADKIMGQEKDTAEWQSKLESYVAELKSHFETAGEIFNDFRSEFDKIETDVKRLKEPNVFEHAWDWLSSWIWSKPKVSTELSHTKVRRKAWPTSKKGGNKEDL